MKYYIKASYGTQAKNNAEKSAILLQKELDGILLPSEESVGHFVDLLKGIIDTINQDNPRCTDIKVSYRPWSELGSGHVSVGEVLTFCIYQVKKETDADIKDEAIDKALQVLEDYMNEGSFYGHGCYLAIEKLKKAKGLV